MVDKAKELIPSFIMDGIKNISEPLNRAEKAIERARETLMKRAGDLDTKDVKKVFDDVRKQIERARGELESLFADGMGRTMQALNLPSREELEAVKADIAQLSKDLKALKKPAKKAAKKPAAPKKAAPKKAAKKAAPKKAAPKKAAPKKAAKKAGRKK